MKCPACPIQTGSCVGECPGSGFFCAVAARDESGRKHVVGRSKYPCPGSTAPAREYRRGKPVMRLGERQKPRANCKGCGTA